MERNMKLIRRILEYVKCHGSAHRPTDPTDIIGYTTEEIDYHVRLCVQAGFVEPEPNASHFIRSLTWQGHEALERLQNGKAINE